MKKELLATIYTSTGKEAGKIQLPAVVFDVKWNDTLMHQVVVGMQDNARTPVAHTKDRGEVRGGGKKPWQQKGTGRARHGSIRSPLWRGGGVTFGPRNEKSYAQKINRKVRAKALYMALSQKWRDGEVLFIDTLGLSDPKTAQAKKITIALSGAKGFEELSSKKHNAALVATGGRDLGAVKSFSNFGNISVEETRNLNPVEVLKHKYLIIANPEESIRVLESRITSKKESQSPQPAAKK
jgi:large subunit ribosomal protein L4